MPTDTSEAKAKFRATLADQFPAYCHWLLHDFVLPKELEENQPRFGLREYHHPELFLSLFEDTPASELITLIDSAVFENEEGQKLKLWELPPNSEENSYVKAGEVWWGSAVTLQQLMQDEWPTSGNTKYYCSVAGEAKKLFRHNKCDRLLGRLKEDLSHRVADERWTRGPMKGRRGWLISSR